MTCGDGSACQQGTRSIDQVLCDAGRLARLKATDLIGTPPDEEFDRLSRLASKTLHTPIALVTLVTENEQYFKSCLGMPEPWNTWRKSPLSHSFCQHVVARCAPLVITDSRTDDRVSDNRAIQDMGVIAYLGIPLTTPDGWCLGSFCVIDREPRQWSPDDIWVVQTLAHSVMSEIELRQHRRHLHEMVQERTAQLATELDRGRQLQEELQHALDAANSANEVKRRFIATLSHELRTPLTPVLLSASMGADDEQLPPDARETLGMIRDQVELEAQLIDELLQAAELVQGRIVPALDRVDLHDLLGRVIDEVGSEARRKQVRLERQFNAPDPHVRADAKRLSQAFGAVLSNSLRYSAPGSRILLRTAPAETEDKVRVEFIDEGIGLSAEELQHVFDPFWQADQQVGRGGIGLGLTIARTLVELHGGTMTAGSDGPGQGATFTICLPKP